MTETNCSPKAVELPAGNGLGLGDGNYSVAMDAETGCYLQQRISQELISTTVRLCLESPCTKHLFFRETVSIQHLPCEILAHIFAFLNVKERIRNELVCRRWRSIGKQIPWIYPTKLVFTRNGEASSFNMPITELNDNILFSILSRCGSCLKQITLTSKINDDVVLTPKSVMTIGLLCPNLEVIKLHLLLTSSCLDTLARGCPNLKVVQIRNFEVEVHDGGVISILKKCHQLEWLDVADVCLSDGWFEEVNPKLRKLCLFECSIRPISMRNLLKKCDSLQELQLRFGNRIEVDQLVLFEVLNHFKETLKVLKIKRTNFNTDINEEMTWCEGLSGLHRLEELWLEMCPSVDDALLEILGKECSKLRVLAVPGSLITDKGLEALIALPWLKILDISFLNISGEGLEHLAERGVLEEVYLKSANVKEECCCALAKFCPNLRLLDVTGTTDITNRLVKEFAAAAKRTFFKNCVRLVVACTLVMKNDVTWEGLEVRFN